MILRNVKVWDFLIFKGIYKFLLEFLGWVFFNVYFRSGFKGRYFQISNNNRGRGS